MKICVISFDFWQYDGHIVDVLRKMGIYAHHINLGAYRHKNLAARTKNAFSKVFLKKNLKKQQRQQLILDSLKKMGKQDQILVINPEQIDREYHSEIKKYTSRYIAYLYDSLARNPAEHVLDLFDKIFSFDKNDAQKHGFQLITNYNYLPEEKISENSKYSLVYLASFDNRLLVAEKIAQKLQNFNLTYFYKIVGKKSWKKNMGFKKNPSIIYTRKRTNHAGIPDFYRNGKVILDLVRENQYGLSFRIFEAMALKKKIITNNETISQYDFYNPNNILILKSDLSNLEKLFFDTEYEELPTEIYEKYTLDYWVTKVFNIS